jgi:hypothetical protein
MNEKQYAIVKWVLNVGAKPTDLAKAFGIDVSEVVRVRDTDNYKQFKEGGGEDMFSQIFGKNNPFGI